MVNSMLMRCSEELNSKPMMRSNTTDLFERRKTKKSAVGFMQIEQIMNIAQ